MLLEGSIGKRNDRLTKSTAMEHFQPASAVLLRPESALFTPRAPWLIWRRGQQFALWPIPPWLEGGWTTNNDSFSNWIYSAVINGEEQNVL